MCMISSSKTLNEIKINLYHQKLCCPLILINLLTEFIEIHITQVSSCNKEVCSEELAKSSLTWSEGKRCVEVETW